MPQIAFSSAESAPSELLTLMMYPDDESARRQALVAGNVYSLTRESSAAPITLSAAMARDLLNAPSYAHMKADQAVRTKEGFIAGGILSGVYIMDRFGMSPSLNRGFHAYSNYVQTTTYGDGTAIPTSEPKMRECWSRFRSVSPLWAAIHLNKDYPFAPERSEFKPEYIARFLEVAEGIRAFAVSFVPKYTRGRVPILDPNTTWEMPAGTRPRILNSDRLPEKLAAFLQDYKAPRNNAFG